MMLRTHLALSVLIALLFLPHISSRGIFILVLLVATILPDADTAFSTAGNNIFSKIIQFFVKHRGFLHSLTFCVGISVLAALSYPVIALPFFLGYGFHIFLDSFTKEGVMPFWPWRKISSGFIKTGGKVESTLFISLIIIDIILGIIVFSGF